MTSNIFRARVKAICKDWPGAELADPWGGGHEAWKIGGKMFACIGTVTPGIAVKTPDVDTANMLIEAGIGIKAPYFHKSWLLLPEDTTDDELAHRLAVSYDTVRAGLTRKVQASLPPRDDTA